MNIRIQMFCLVVFSFVSQASASLFVKEELGRSAPFQMVSKEQFLGESQFTCFMKADFTDYKHFTVRFSGENPEQSLLLITTVDGQQPLAFQKATISAEGRELRFEIAKQDQQVLVPVGNNEKNSNATAVVLRLDETVTESDITEHVITSRQTAHNKPVYVPFLSMDVEFGKGMMAIYSDDCYRSDSVSP